LDKSKILEKEVDVEKNIQVCNKNLERKYEQRLKKRKNIPKFIKKCEVIKKIEKENIKLSDIFSGKKYFNVLTY
jgi:hypothetical protein